jgi:NAD(P)-dependent dehydrogenase (short-subunit alcohol dehydrogenase family)
MTAFANRIALITGAGSGIGKQLAMELGRQGAAIAAVDLASEPLAALEGQLAGVKLAWQVADVTDRETLGPAVAKLQERLGPIDLLIANAGIGCETSALNFRAADFERIVRVNLIGVANSVETVLPGMIERKRGHIVGMSSLASFRGLPRMAGYCASKAGLNSLLDSLRVDLRETGIRVTTICPGWIRTALTDQVEHEMPDLMEVDHAVRVIVGAIARESPFVAFPGGSARRIRLAGMLPCGISDSLILRMFRSLKKRERGRDSWRSRSRFRTLPRSWKRESRCNWSMCARSGSTKPRRSRAASSSRSTSWYNASRKLRCRRMASSSPTAITASAVFPRRISSNSKE